MPQLRFSRDRTFAHTIRRRSSAAVLAALWLCAWQSATLAAQPQVLTNDGRLKADPAFIPGANAISYTVLEEPTRLSLLRLDLATGATTRLHPDAKASEFELAWSQDGKRYAYVQSRGNLNLKLVIHDVQENKDFVYDAGGGFSGMHSPSFAPDGESLLFSIPAAGGQQIAACNSSGLDRRTITQTPGISNWPSYSPDGKRLLFGSSREGDFEIFTTLPDGGDPRRLTASPGRDMRPRFSPDGGRIAFASHRDGNLEIYVMQQDGSQPRNITQHAESDDHAAWQPDGKRLVTVSQRDGRYDLLLWDVDE